ncbi:MAG: reverse transcriptase domain-containing protein, partial [Candidatus Thermoplasmatota archaeon]|nr:reverse transcriptase domain-containing protein [Candidatus Thermoplasmatota archaeon]
MSVVGSSRTAVAEKDAHRTAREIPLRGERREAMTQLLLQSRKEKVIEPVPVKQLGRAALYSPVFPVPKKKKGEWRLIHDLRRLNAHLPARRFRVEAFNVVRDLLQPGDYMTIVDVKSAFHLLRVVKRDRDVLRFKANGQHWRYRAMPMGHRWAPYTWTKVFKQALRGLRKHIRMVPYMDDVLLMARSARQLAAHLQRFIDTMERLGIRINWSKSDLVARQRAEFLGVIVNSLDMSLEATRAKRRQIRRDARRLLQAPARPATCRQIAALLGRLEFLRLTSTTIRLHTRFLQRAKNRTLARTRGDWTALVQLDGAARAELEYWSTRAAQPMRAPLRRQLATWRLTTDASPSGWGAVLAQRQSSDKPWQTKRLTSGFWNDAEAKRSSNNRELRAIWLGLQALGKWVPRESALLIESDNTTAVSYVRRQFGHSPDLSDLAALVWAELQQIGATSIAVKHTPGARLVLADRLSRLPTDREAWMLRPSLFAEAQRVFGKAEVDLFADRN